VAVAFVLLNATAWLFMRERALILLLVSVFVLVGDLYYSFGSLFLGLRRVGYRFVTGLIDVALLVVLVQLAVRLGWSLRGILVCYVISSVMLVAVTALVVRWRFGPYPLVLDRTRLRGVLAEAFPFFVLVFLGLAYLKVDTLMIFFIRTAEEVALYEAAYKFFEVSRFVVRSTGMVFFPICAQMVAQSDWEGLRSVVRKLLIGAVAAGTALSIGVISLAPVAVPAVWGSAYGTSIVIVRILFLGLPFLYVSYVSAFVAHALELERRVLGITAAAVVFNVSMNALVIPAWGAVGAAWTTVIGESLLALTLAALVVRAARRLPRAELAGAGAA
jgi:O-antigen/teichoic acid export membrane protein